MRRCEMCGSELRENSKFCLKCGAPVFGQQSPEYNSPSKKNKSLAIIIGSAAGVFVFLMVILFTGLVKPGWLRKTTDTNSEAEVEVNDKTEKEVDNKTDIEADKPTDKTVPIIKSNTAFFLFSFSTPYLI